MKVKTITVILFDGLGHYPPSGQCEHQAVSLCGRAGVGIFQTGGSEAHVLCREHAEDIFLQMIGDKV